MHETHEIKLTAVWTGSGNPPSTLRLEDYVLPLEKPIEGFVHALYGNSTAYSALGEVLMDAKSKGQQYSTAILSLIVRQSVRTGVIHREDIEQGRTGVVNLTRLSKEVMVEVAGIYKQGIANKPSLLHMLQLEKAVGVPFSLSAAPDWKRAHSFMPEHTELLPKVFDLLKCEVLIHPVRFKTTPRDKHHYIASFKPRSVNIHSAIPNPFEPGPHPERIVV